MEIICGPPIFGTVPSDLNVHSERLGWKEMSHDTDDDTPMPYLAKYTGAIVLVLNLVDIQYLTKPKKVGLFQHAPRNQLRT
jgi:hypothetical protein